MRPLAVAAKFNIDDRLVMDAFLRATVVGLLEMRWELFCPSCRGIKANATRLSELAESGHCSACGLDFSANVDDAIEARFYPSPRVRRVDVGTYCIGGPMHTPHRIFRGRLDDGPHRTWTIQLAAGSYVLRCPASRGVVQVLVDEDASSSSLAATLSADTIEPGTALVRAGAVSVQVTNRTGVPTTVSLDERHWSEHGCTPGRMMLFPEFQSLFSAEALAPGVQLEVGRVGLLFSDLAGSTALYERVGDARAFRLVARHFALLRTIIEQHGGVLVKTIGDAVMAAFPDGRMAAVAALDIQQAICEMPTDGYADASSLLKLGVHEGACFIVTQNDRLDYFGSAVNIAARAQHEARGGEVVLTSEVFDVLSGNDVSRVSEPQLFSAALRGIAEPVRLYRIRLASAAVDDPLNDIVT